MSKKLAAKAGLIQVPPVSTSSNDGQVKEEVADQSGRAKTAPGSMLAFMTQQSASVREAELLRSRLAEFDGAAPVRQLDPTRVRASRWANRHADSFTGAEFESLKAEIAAAGGNVQPIKVRPLLNNEEHDWEVVFGHRRHRSCLELGLPVAALCEPVSDQELFVQMERENRSRRDLSAWEQGQMYRRALDEGLYPSQIKLAEAIGRDVGDVGKALRLAALPTAIVDAFKSPLDLQFRWAKALADAQQADPEGLLSRAKKLRAERGMLSAKEIFSRLLNERSSADHRPSSMEVPGIGFVDFSTEGRVSVKFKPALDWNDQTQRLYLDFLKQFLEMAKGAR